MLEAEGALALADPARCNWTTVPRSLEAANRGGWDAGLVTEFKGEDPPGDSQQDSAQNHCRAPGLPGQLEGAGSTRSVVLAAAPR